MAKIVNEEEFDKLIAGDKPVLCDFFATWCGPCKMLGPVIEEAEVKYGDRIEFVKVDIDQSFALSVRYGIMSVPYVALFKGGEIADKFIGYSTLDEVDEFVKNNL